MPFDRINDPSASAATGTGNACTACAVASANREREQMNERLRDMIRAAKLRPTRQRVALARILFGKGQRHLTAEDLHRDALEAGTALSLATVYNALNQFAEAGLIRAVSLPSDRTFYDTDTGDHQHFYIEEEQRIVDVPSGGVRIGALPVPPPGYEIARVDVVIGLRRLTGPTGAGGDTKPPRTATGPHARDECVPPIPTGGNATKI